MSAMVDVDHDRAAASLPLEKFHVGDPALFQNDVWMPYFARLRREDPVHYCAASRFGPYWSVTKYKDILQVETNHRAFSSESALGGISIVDAPEEYRRPNFLKMDPPRHDEHRKVVQPIVAPDNLAKLSGIIRERTVEVLDSLPRNQVFNWVDRVSVELTTRMLATLFDFPFDERRKLTYWSDVVTADITAGGPINSEEKRFAELQTCLEYFTRLWKERANAPPRPDLISMLAHGEATRHLPVMELLGTLTLLIVGGNDTTRNSMSAGVWFFHQHPRQYEKLRNNPTLVDSAVPEIIRYHTPITHMRRTATRDIEFQGKRIRRGDKVVMWYISGNRDDEVIERPDEFIIDRKRPREHLSFGFGLHRCVGNRLAELQLRVLWTEIIKRFRHLEVMGEPKRVYSAFVHGISELPVRIPA